MLQQLNIHGKFDPSYRYKMPKLETNFKKNNKTYFTNLPKVAEALNRSPNEIIKWFGYTLGGNTNAKDYSINGKYETKKLQTLLQDFINCHVLCGVCGNPETVYAVVKGEPVKQCASCGKTSTFKIHSKMTKYYKK